MKKNKNVRKNLIFILIGLAIADLLGSIDSTGVNIALPKISQDFNISVDQVQWVTNAYTLALVATLIIMGKIGDRIGNKKLYIWGLTLFGAASLGAGFAPNISSLVIFRTVQGVGTAILYTMPISIIAHLWKEREKAFAVTASFFSLGLLIGPVLGGYFSSISLDSFSGWHLIFLINIPFIIFGIIVSALLIPKLPTFKESRIDYRGAYLMLSGLLILVFTLVNGMYYLLMPSVLILLAFVLSENKIKNPLIELNLFRNKTFSSANLTSFTAMVAVIGLSFINTFFLQETLDWDPWQAGKAMLPIPAAMVVGAIVGGSLKNWKIGSILSSALILMGLIFLANITPETSYFSGLFVGYILAGVGGGLMMTTIFSAIMGSAPTRKSGQASGILNTIQQLGALVGVAIMAGTIAHYKVSYYILSAIMFVGLIAAFFINKGQQKTVSNG